MNSESSTNSHNTAKYCNIDLREPQEEGDPPLISISWDTQKLQSSLTANELKDNLLLRNIVSGRIITGKLWPILLDDSEDPLARKRSTAFMNELLTDWSLFKQLNDQEVLFLFVGIRDLWLADSRGLLDAADKKLLNDLLELIDDDIVPSAEHHSMSFSFCPTKNRRILKFIEHLEEVTSVDQVLLQSVAQLRVDSVKNTPLVNTAPLYAVWVDARELSYHNFECILPLGRALSARSNSTESRDNGAVEPLRFDLSGIESLHPSMRVFKCKLEGPDCQLLLQLDELGLYQKPANSSTRGGERFIFSSTALSKGLTDAIKSSDLSDRLRDNNYSPFDFVNYVFRCNRFAPTDAKFEMHMDTPYYDAAKHNISKYTILIYLTGGSAKPTLKLRDGENEVHIDHVDAMECIVFDQHYEHEGYPFTDSPKVFLRSELIFCDYTLEHQPEIGKLFSSAVYMTVQSTFQPELSRHAHHLYEQVNAAHWGLDKAEKISAPVLHKCWNETLHFASNGCDYWFPYVQKENDPDSLQSNPQKFLKLAAVTAVLDYLNCHLELSEKKSNLFGTFRSQCESQVITPADVSSVSEWILSYLWNVIGEKQTADNTKTVPIVSSDENKKRIWFNKELYAIKERYHEKNGSATEPVEDLMVDINMSDMGEFYNLCCPGHCYNSFVPWQCQDVIDEFAEWCSTNRSKLLSMPLTLLDQTLHLDEENIVIEDDKIYICDKNKLHCNFASCWNSEPAAYYFGTEKNILAPDLLVPPISFIAIPASVDNKSGPGFQLMMDFFKNDWLLPDPEKLTESVKVPNLEGPDEHEQVSESEADHQSSEGADNYIIIQ